MIKTKTWIIIVAAVLFLSVAACVWLQLRPAPGTIANVYQNGVCIKSFDLSTITVAETFKVSGNGGENIILVEPGRICILEADCPDQVCVKNGWLVDSASPIVCLPHRLVIQLEGEAAESDEVDTVSR